MACLSIPSLTPTQKLPNELPPCNVHPPHPKPLPDAKRPPFLCSNGLLEPTMPQTALLADPISKLHDTGPGHPEQPARYDAVVASLAPLARQLKPLDSRNATDDELAPRR